ncbi:hypothetical protein ACLOJK_026125 [Asimina triloba]
MWTTVIKREGTGFFNPEHPPEISCELYTHMNDPMDLKCIASILVGASSSFIFLFPSFRRWRRERINQEKLRMITEALEQAEERLFKFQERHDRILNQISSHYLYNQELAQALVDARKAMTEALLFSVILRQMQMKIISTYPYENKEVPMIGKAYGNTKQPEDPEEGSTTDFQTCKYC